MWIDDAPLWMKRGFCRGANPDIFDGEPGYDEIAKGYCLRCDVRLECLEYALSRTDVIGVWGGMTEYERTAQKRGGKRASCPGCRGVNVYSDGSSEICVSCGVSWKS